MSPMHRSIAAAMTLVCLGCVSETHRVTVRGAVMVKNNDWFLSVCDSSDVYWVRVLASNAHFKFSRRIEELSSASSEGAIIATLSGDLEGPPTFMAPKQEVQGILTVSQVVSVERGSCGAGESPPEQGAVAK